MNTHSTKLIAAMTLALGVPLLPQQAAASTIAFNWSGLMTMLDPTGAVLANTQITGKGANQYHTPISGTLTLESSGSGSLTMQPFYFFGNPVKMSMSAGYVQAIGGDLLLFNADMNWGGGNGIPVSAVLDASGLFSALPAWTPAAIGTTISGVGARPASDGTYVGYAYALGQTDGYLDRGPVPIATTKWNTTPLCPPGGGNSGACMSVFPSGGLPLIADTVANTYDYNAPFMGGDGSNDPGIGGSPMLAGPFENYSMNFDFTSLTVTAVVVPVPAAAWLLGSGLVGLIGVTRRRRTRTPAR
jgi:hypothetical protein